MTRINYEALQDKASDNVDSLDRAQEAASMHDWLTNASNHELADQWREWAVAREADRLEQLANEAQDEARQTEREWRMVG